MTTHALTLQALSEHGDFVRRLSHGLLQDATADDVVQDTWLSFLRQPPRASNPRSWLASVVMNRARKQHRQDLHRAAREAAAARAEAVDPASASAERLELQQQVVAAVLALPDHYRQAILLTYYEGLSSADAARRLGIPAGTLRAQVSRGLAELRSKLDRTFPGGRAAWSLALLRLSRAGLGAGAKVAAIAALAGGLSVAAWLVTSTPAPSNGSVAAAAAPAVPAEVAATGSSTATPAPTAREQVPAAAAAPAAAQDPDYSKMATPELQNLALWIQQRLRTLLLTADPDDVGAELAALRGHADTGAIRLLRAQRFEFAANEPLGLRCGGSYYSFVGKNHKCDSDTDLWLQTGSFGAVNGYLLDLGDLPLAELTATPPATLAPRAAQAYAHMWSTGYDPARGATAEFDARARALQLSSYADSAVARTYLLRSMVAREHDVLVAFRSVASDATGHTLVYRVLHRFSQVDGGYRAPAGPVATGKPPAWIAEQSAEQLLAALDDLRAVAQARLLAVPEALSQQHAAELGPTSGLCRILQRGRFAALTRTRGECAYYDFVKRSHDFNDQPHVVLGQGLLHCTRGLLVDLGNVPLAQAEVAATHTDRWAREAVEFLVAPITQRDDTGRLRISPDRQEIAQRKGYVHGATAAPNHTYLLRYAGDATDLTVALRVLESDDDGATLLWRIVSRK